jgi:hypothetical protein
VARVGNRWFAELSLDDIGRQFRNVLIGNLARELLAEPWADEAPQVALNVFPRFDPGPHVAVTLEHLGLHPFDVLGNHLINGAALPLMLLLLLAHGLDDGNGTVAPEHVDLGPRVLDVEGLGIVDAEPAGALLAGAGVGELVVERRDAGRGDADEKPRAFSVINLGPPLDTFFAHAVGESDRLLALALGNQRGGDAGPGHQVRGVDFDFSVLALALAGGFGDGKVRIVQSRLTADDQS